MTVKAYAKINWTLDVKSRRPDGYHEIDSLMQSISLHDELTFTTDNSLKVICDNKELTQPDNSVMRAVQLLYKLTQHQKGVSIRLKKNIPIAAGLGGGSADAAATLIAMAKHWNTGLTAQELMDIGRGLGADVPFCLIGGTARARGIGEILNPLKTAEPIWLTLVKPCEGLSTAEVYSKLDVNAITRRPFNDFAAAALQNGNLGELANTMCNVLEPVAVALRPEIREALEDVRETGALKAQMTGSGPVVFGLYPSRHTAEAAMFLLKSRYKECHLVYTMPEGVVL